MIIIAILIGCIIGAVIGINAPVIPYTYSIFLAIAVVAALDSVFVGRMFTNLTIIRRHYIEKWTEKRQEKLKNNG